jgi:hypothetical protein
MTASSLAPEPSRPRRAYRRVVLYLAAGLVAVDVVVATQASRWRVYDPVYYRERLAHARRGGWDFVIVGGSPAMAGIDPSVLTGVRWGGRPLEHGYNLGLPLGTTAEVCLSVEHGLRRPPRLLLYGITASDLNDDRVEPQGPRYLMAPGDVVRWARRRPADALWCVKQFLQERLGRGWQLFSYRDGIRLWAADNAERLWPGLCADAAAEARQNLFRSEILSTGPGLIAPPPAPRSARLDVLKAEGRPIPPFPFLDHFRLGDYLAQLHRLLDWAAGHSVPLVLVDLPVPADLDKERFPREFAAYRAALAEVARERQVPLVQATRETVGLSDADFSDLIHLNGDGARRLSTWLRQAVEECQTGVRPPS